jgi:hypothetical protein
MGCARASDSAGEIDALADPAVASVDGLAFGVPGATHQAGALAAIAHGQAHVSQGHDC